MNLFSGNINSTVVDIKIIVTAGLKLMASAVLVGHNHPSNSLKPSKRDLELTQKLKSALEFMDMTLLDHIIVSPSGTYLSFIEQGQL
jgi:DNA repair protein RadC